MAGIHSDRQNDFHHTLDHPGGSLEIHIDMCINDKDKTQLDLDRWHETADSQT